MYKHILFAGVSILFLGAQSLQVQAAELSMDSLVGNVGIAAVTDEVMDASQYLAYADTSVSTLWGYKELGIAVVEGNLNVRKEPAQGAEIVGKMANYAACEILGEADGWYYISSGEVQGYVSAEFIVTGIEAKLIGLEQAYSRAVVKTDGLNVREQPSEDAGIITKVAKGEELEYIDTKDGWVTCLLNSTEVYVKEEFVDIKEGLNTAITMAQLRYGMEVSEVRVDLCEYAVQFVGNPYVWGGTSLTKGADCSGFTLKIYEKYGVELPHKAQLQSGYGTTIDPSDAQPGDLLFYGSSTKNITHVAIYIGDGQIVHANDSKTGIIISNANYRTPVTASRLLEE